MQQLLLIAIAAAVLCCALLAPAFQTKLLRPRKPPRRLVILPVDEDCERLESRLLYERERARQEGGTDIFLLERCAGTEACEIARRFCRGEPEFFCGSAAELREAIGDDAVYKVVEIVLY